jgi:hypothetical protein
MSKGVSLEQIGEFIVDKGMRNRLNRQHGQALEQCRNSNDKNSQAFSLSKAGEAMLDGRAPPRPDLGTKYCHQRSYDAQDDFN